jgi:chromosome segregation ATPase
MTAAPQFDIHPQSQLGTLRSAVEAARTAHDATTQQLATLQGQAGELDEWLDAANLDTQPLDYATTSARRAILANVMNRLRAEQQTLGRAIADIQAQSAPHEDKYIELSRELAALEDPMNVYTRRMPPYLRDERLNQLWGWMHEWTQLKAETVEV